MGIEIKIFGDTAKEALKELGDFAGGLIVPRSVVVGTADAGVLTAGAASGRGVGGPLVGVGMSDKCEPAQPGCSNSASTQPGVTESAATHDKAGLPWDERIHSSNRAFNADGTWRRRRGVSDDLVKQVEAELRGGDQPGGDTAPAPQQAEPEQPVDSPEVEAQDAADEQAEAEATKKPDTLTLDDVRKALGEYVKKFGMPAAQEDGPKVIALMFGEGKGKVSDIPDDQASLAKAVAGVEEMLAKNPFRREAVNG